MGLFGCEYLETRGAFLTEYFCRCSREKLPPQTARDVCMGSGYTACYTYKQAARWWFITTAACKALGKAEDCEELHAFKCFRDRYLYDRPEGRDFLEDYYKTAPQIVAAIDQSPDKFSVYRWIYNEYIAPCVQLIAQGKDDACFQAYRNMFTALKTQYLPPDETSD